MIAYLYSELTLLVYSICLTVLLWIYGSLTYTLLSSLHDIHTPLIPPWHTHSSHPSMTYTLLSSLHDIHTPLIPPRHTHSYHPSIFLPPPFPYHNYNNLIVQNIRACSRRNIHTPTPSYQWSSPSSSSDNVCSIDWTLLQAVTNASYAVLFRVAIIRMCIMTLNLCS